MLRKKFLEFGPLSTPRHEFNKPSFQIKTLLLPSLFANNIEWIFVSWIENWKELYRKVFLKYLEPLQNKHEP